MTTMGPVSYNLNDAEQEVYHSHSRLFTDGIPALIQWMSAAQNVLV